MKTFEITSIFFFIAMNAHAEALSRSTSIAGVQQGIPSEETKQSPTEGQLSTPLTAPSDTGENISADFVPPKLKSEPQIVYPEQAFRENIEAEVIMQIDIDVQGRVEDVMIVTPAVPAGYGFDEVALEAARGFEFDPAKENNVPVPVRITYRYVFSLQEMIPIEKKDLEPIENKDKKELETKREQLNTRFEGLLLERGTRLPLIGVKVTIFRSIGENNEQKQGFETITNQDGRFVFYNLAPSAWKVFANPDGYFPLRTEETLKSKEVTTAKYYIEKSSYNPYDVLVEGEQVRKDVSRTTLTVKQIEKIPGNYGDVLKVIQTLPGVARTSPVSGNLIIRGSAPEDSEVYVDGINVPIIYHFGGTRSVIPEGMLDKLDFYPGNFSVRYGRATGGIVDVSLKTLMPEKIGGYLDLNIFDSGLYLETPIGDRAAVAIGARRSYIDSFINAVVPDNAPVNLVTAPRYYDYQLLANYRPAPAHELKAFFFGSDDKLRVLFDNPTDFSPQITADDASTSTSFYRVLLQHQFVPNEHFENVLEAASGRNSIYFGLGDQIFLNIDSYNAQLRDTLSWKFNKHFAITTGIDYLFTRADTRIKFPDLIKEGEIGAPDLSNIRYAETTNADFHSFAAFLEFEANLFQKLLLVPGVRFDYFSQVHESSFSPRLTARYAASRSLTFKGGVGLFTQEPSFDETNSVFGNPNLGLEQAIHYSLGAEYQPFSHITVDVTGFYKDLNHLVSRVPQDTELSIADLINTSDDPPVRFENKGQGRVYGLEILIKHDFSNNFNGWLSYTLSRAERKDIGADSYRLFDFDQTHILTALGTYSMPRNWSIGFKWRFVSGNPITPRIGSVYNVDRGMYEPVFGEVNSQRVPPFHQLDLRLDKRWVFKTWMLNAYLDIQNIYNRANPVGYQYNFDSSKRAIRQSLPVIPVIGLRGEF